MLWWKTPLLTVMCILQRLCVVSDFELLYHAVLFKRNLSTHLSVSEMSIKIFFYDLILSDKSALVLY